MGASEQYCIRWNNHQRNFITVMDNLLENGVLTDVTLGTQDGRTIKCHQIILATCSTYFHSLLVKAKCEHPIILIKDIKYSEIRAILEFMYKGEVSVAQDQMFDLLKVAEFLKVKGLVNGSDLFSSATTNRETDHSDRADEQQAHASSESSHPNHPILHSKTPPFCASVESPTQRHGVEANFSVPEWPTTDVSSVDDDKSSVAFMNFHPAYLTAQSLRRFPDDGPETSTSRDNSDSIAGKKRRRSQTMKTAHHHGQEDAAIRLPIHRQHSDDSHYGNRSNGSANNESDDNVRKSMDFSHQSHHRTHSPSETDTSLIDDDEKRAQSFLEDTKFGILDYVTRHKDKGKRYKKYSNHDMRSAIAAVKGGQSANKAAELFNVPSRTLYDKIKKLRIASTKKRRGENVGGCPSAAFPYVQLTGNPHVDVNSDIADNNFEEAENDEMMDNPAMIVESTLTETRDDHTIDREESIDRKSPSLRLVPMNTLQGETSPIREDDNEAEDLSVSRKSSNASVISSPSIAIKEDI